MQINIHSDDFNNDEFRQIYDLLTSIHAARSGKEKETEAEYPGNIIPVNDELPDAKEAAYVEEVLRRTQVQIDSFPSDNGAELKETKAPPSIDQSLERVKGMQESLADDTDDLDQYNDLNLPPGKDGILWNGKMHRESQKLDAKGNYLYKRNLDKSVKAKFQDEHQTVTGSEPVYTITEVVGNEVEVAELMPQPDPKDRDALYVQSDVVSDTPRATADRIAEETEVLESQITHICVLKQVTEAVKSGKAPDDLGICIADYLGLESIMQLKDDTAKCKLFSDTWDDAVEIITTMGISCGEKVAPQFATVIQPLLSSGAYE